MKASIMQGFRKQPSIHYVRTTIGSRCAEGSTHPLLPYNIGPIWVKLVVDLCIEKHKKARTSEVNNVTLCTSYVGEINQRDLANGSIHPNY